MKTELSAPVKLWCISAFAEVAVVQRRPELQHLCRAAEEDGLTHEALRGAVPGLTDVGHRRLHEHCRDLKLVDASGRLTEAGRECARSGDVAIPEQGVYSFCVAEHTAFGRRVLHMQRETPDPRDFDTADIVPVTDLVPTGDGVWKGLGTNADRFAVRRLLGARKEPPKGRIEAAAGRASLRWVLDLVSGDNERVLEGSLKLGATETPFRVALPSLPTPDVQGLIGRWDPAWDGVRGLRAMTFDGHAKAGFDGFLRNLEFSSVVVPGEGTFQRVTVAQVPVGPVDGPAAQSWAEVLHRDRLIGAPGYVTEDVVDAEFEAVVKATPLAPLAPTPPPLDELLDALAAAGTKESRAAWWRVAAPADLDWRL